MREHWVVRTRSRVALPLDFGSSLFDGLTSSQIKSVLAAARQPKVSPNQTLQHEGEPAAEICLLVTGVAAFYQNSMAGSKHFIQWISPGDAFGLVTLLAKPHSYHTSVQSLGQVSVLMWDRATVHALASKIPRLRENAYEITTDYLARIADVLMMHMTQTAEQRLARMLVESASKLGRAVHEDIELGLTNEQLAEMAGVSAFTASRQMSEWQSQAIVARLRGKIVLHDLEYLRKLIEPSHPSAQPTCV